MTAAFPPVQLKAVVTARCCGIWLRTPFGEVTGSWRCLQCGKPFCPDCGAQLNAVTLKCSSYKGEKP
jgi:ribosomal protein L34E